jgi:hypothetical protein
LLTLLSGGIIMIIYSVKPNKSYSKKLLGFGWNKPLYAVIFFVVELFALAILVKNIAGFDVPLNGTATIIMPQSMTQGTNVSVAVTASIEWPFYFGIVAAGLGVAARLYHRNVVDSIPPQPK